MKVLTLSCRPNGNKHWTDLASLPFDPLDEQQVKAAHVLLGTVKKRWQKQSLLPSDVQFATRITNLFK
jgi:hypothetical protein